MNQVIWLLSHLSCESIDFRNIIIQSAVYKRVLNSLQQEVINQETIKMGSWLLGNLVRGKPVPDLKTVNLI